MISVLVIYNLFKLEVLLLVAAERLDHGICSDRRSLNEQKGVGFIVR